jgi:hypothetical protein
MILLDRVSSARGSGVLGWSTSCLVVRHPIAVPAISPIPGSIDGLIVAGVSAGEQTPPYQLRGGNSWDFLSMIWESVHEMCRISLLFPAFATVVSASGRRLSYPGTLLSAKEFRSQRVNGRPRSQL